MWGESLDWPGLVSSLDAGRVTITDTGSPLELDVYDAAGEWLGFPGSTVAAGSPTIIRLRGALRNSESQARKAQIVAVRPGTCNDLRAEFELVAPEVPFEVLHEVEVPADNDFDIHVMAQLEAGDVVFGLLHPGSSEVIGVHGAGVTNAVRIE